MNFQPSELAKFGIALYAANYMMRRWTRARTSCAPSAHGHRAGLHRPLLLAEPDMGAFIVIAAIAMGILFLGGVNGRMFLLSVAILLRGLRADDRFQPIPPRAHLCLPQPLGRKYAAGKGYQLTHSLIAFGAASGSARASGQRREAALPARGAHRLLLAVIGEELGLVGVVVAIGAFFWLTRRCFLIGRQAIALDRVFAGLMPKASASGSAPGLHQHGREPRRAADQGLTLPLMSFGGSAVLMNLHCVGRCLAHRS